MCQNNFQKTCWSIIVRRKRKKKQYVLLKDFNIFMYDHTVNRGIKHFCCYCLQTFNTEEIFKFHINNWFKINGKQRIKVPKKGAYVVFKNYGRNKNCHLWSTILVIIFWDFFMFYKFSFNHKWIELWLLVINIVYTSCLTSCQTTEDLVS